VRAGKGAPLPLKGFCVGRHRSHTLGRRPIASPRWKRHPVDLCRGQSPDDHLARNHDRARSLFSGTASLIENPLGRKPRSMRYDGGLTSSQAIDLLPEHELMSYHICVMAEDA
jgi:hypothetical protein